LSHFTNVSGHQRARPRANLGAVVPFLLAAGRHAALQRRARSDAAEAQARRASALTRAEVRGGHASPIRALGHFLAGRMSKNTGISFRIRVLFSENCSY
jgi:hypothetical protein